MLEERELCEAGHPQVPGLACTRTGPCEVFHAHRPTGEVWPVGGAPPVPQGAAPQARSRRARIAEVAARTARVGSAGAVREAVEEWRKRS